MNYVTLHQVKEYMKLSTSYDDDMIFNNWIQWSSELINWWKGRRFDVFRATYLLDTPMQPNTSIGEYYHEASPMERLFLHNKLFLDVSKFDLLEVIELLNGDETEITEYFLEPVGFSKKNRIKIRRGSGVQWKTNSDGEYEQVISLTGFFGFNSNYPNCFIDTGIELASQLNSSATEINLPQDASVLLPAKDFLAPRIQIGNMLRIVSGGQVEFMLVEDIDTDYSDVIIVQRGYNGTEAVTHSIGSRIEVYRPDGNIIQMALQLVRWRYRNKDVDNFDRTFNLATQTVTTPSALPSDVRMILGTRRPSL